MAFLFLLGMDAATQLVAAHLRYIGELGPALASQLQVAVYAVTQVKLQGELDGREIYFTAQGRKLLKPGWRALLSNNDQDEDANPIPTLQIGSQLSATVGKLLSKKNQPVSSLY